jgi:hypothetical protein
MNLGLSPRCWDGRSTRGIEPHVKVFDKSEAWLARLVAQQTSDALFGVSRLPEPDRGSVDAHAPRATTCIWMTCM